MQESRWFYKNKNLVTVAQGTCEQPGLKDSVFFNTEKADADII